MTYITDLLRDYDFKTSPIAITPSSGIYDISYTVLTSTNIHAPLSSWTPLPTNQFNPNGTFDFTNAIVPSQPRLFYNVMVVP